MDPNKPKAYTDMTLSELVIAYNQMANSPVGKQCDIKPVQSFRDKETAVRRCTGAEVKIRAATASESKSIDRLKFKVPADAVPAEAAPKAKKERTGTNLEKLIKLLQSGHEFTGQELSQGLYGDPDKVGAMKMVMKGVQVAIDKGRIAGKIVKERGPKGMTYQLKENN